MSCASVTVSKKKENVENTLFSQDYGPSLRIAELRKNRGLTQLDLANIVGVTETTIANWEKGRTGADWILKLALLCTALECSLDDLILGNIGKNIQRLREKKEFTQRALAKAVGVSRSSTIAGWENRGTADEKIIQITRLCVELGCKSPDELLGVPPKKRKGASKHRPLSQEELFKQLKGEQEPALAPQDTRVPKGRRRPEPMPDT